MRLRANARSGLAIATFCLALVSVLAATAAPSPKPNILLCIADDASYPFMSAYGCKWVKTPGFDRVASQGILFQNAYTPNAKCAPSRACLLTGRNSWQLEAACNHVPFFPAKFRTYAEALATHGYFVGQTGKGWAPGVEGAIQGKPRHLAGRPFAKRKLQPPTTGIAPDDYAGNFADFLAACPPGQPWCFWYGGREPHRPYEYGSGVAKGGKKLSDIGDVLPFWPDNDVVRNDLLDYAFELEYFDQHLLKMLDLLAARGQLDNTLVIVTADNGMPFPRVKGQEYELSNHLPLAMMWKQGIKKPGRVVTDFISFIDFAPTFVELAGLNWAESGMEPTPGRSLTDIFNSEKAGRVNPARDHVLIGKERHDVGRPHDWGYPIRGLVTDGFLYLCNFQTNRWPAGDPETGYLNCDGSPTKTEILKGRTHPATPPFWQWSFGKRVAEELFRLDKDRACLENVAGHPELRARQEALRQQLFTELKAQQDPRMFGHGEVFEAYPYADPACRNFYERHLSGEKITAPWVNPTDFETGPIP